MSQDAAAFGEVLRRLRTTAARSQEALAERAGLSVRGISDLERGVRRAPHLTTVSMLADALGLRPEDRRALLTAARPGRLAQTPTSAPAIFAPLPLPLTPLIGRERELAALSAMLGTGTARLVTLTGTGGTGKTRLALEAGDRLQAEFPDGVVFVDLTPLTDAALVLPAIANAIGVRQEGLSVTDRLAVVLAGKQLLLVMDNFERVVDAAPAVADLLARVPGLSVLATSRMPLHVSGEQEYPLPPLQLPDPGLLPGVEHLSEYEAVRLFVVRAQGIDPHFAMTNANASVVAAICHRLDGLPLAIELAAARIKMLPPQVLLQRLEKRLPLLTGGARTLPVRQQTMRDAIAWSHDLLSLEEQTIFRRLAVFSGGCTLEAAEAVAGAEETTDVFAGIAALIDNSLLRQVEDSTGEPRFHMLETVREYGLERLEASGEQDAIRRGLAAWCLTLAETAEPELLSGPKHAHWVSRLDDEMPNLRAVATWLLEFGEATTALRLLAATDDYWIQRFHHAEVRAWLIAALAAAPAAPPIDRATGYHVLVFCASNLGNHDEAAVHAQHALQAANESSDPFAIGRAHYNVGMAWEHRGDGKRAADAYAKALPFLRESGVQNVAAWVQADLADKLVWCGDLDAAVPMLDEALVLLRHVGFEWGVAMALGQRGHAALAQGELPLAAHFFRESIDAAQKDENMRIALGAAAGLAGIALALDQTERATRLLGATEAARVTIGVGRVAHGLHAERILEAAHGALAKPQFAHAWSAGQLLTPEEAVTEALAVADEVAPRIEG